MKTKKPRAGKAVKPAARTIRRATRSKPKTLRRKPSPVKSKAAKSKATKKPKRPARPRTRTPAKVKPVRRRVIRKPRVVALQELPLSLPPAILSPLRRKRAVRGARRVRLMLGEQIQEAQEIAPIPVAGELPSSPAVAAPEPESEPVPPEQAEVSPTLKAEEPREEAAPAVAGFKIPPILLEGDEPSPPSLTGPGQKYALGPMSQASQRECAEARLPEAYGTGKLLLAARDPHWLYAHWDLTPQQQRHYNALSADRHLVVRVLAGAIADRPVGEVHVHPESRHWFLHVERADTQYVAKLGYYRPPREWVTVATSAPAVTPPDTVSADQTVRFATIPAHARLTELAALAKQAVPADLPLADAARERALAELVAQRLVPQGQAGSVGIPELVGGRGEKQISPALLAQPAPSGGEVESVSSPMAPAEQRPGGVWFSINAELVLYGATEPGASVTIGGQPVALRPDGNFSCRCSLPDGDHAVTVSAMSAEGELRQATLSFSRRTDHQGEVGAAPQDPSLQPPGAETP
jgi:uncharacterized protein